MPITKAQAIRLSEDFEALDREIKALTKRRDEIKPKLIEYAKAKGNKADIDRFTVSVIESWRFDTAKVTKAFPPAKFPDYYKLAVDTESLKADVPESKRKALQTPSYTLNVARNDE